MLECKVFFVKPLSLIHRRLNLPTKSELFVGKCFPTSHQLNWNLLQLSNFASTVAENSEHIAEWNYGASFSKMFLKINRNCGSGFPHIKSYSKHETAQNSPQIE